MRNLLVIFILVLSALRCGAQSLAVEPHYPASAFVTSRLLPFRITGQEGVSIIEVELKDSSSCSAMIDPYYQDTFHLFCSHPEVFSAEVRVQDSFSGDLLLELDKISVVNQRPPSDAFDSTSRTPNALNKGGR